MIYAFIGSVILLGLGLGFVLVSLVGFSDASLSNNLKQESIEILMQDNLYLKTYDKDSIGYQELDIDNIRIEYKIDKACKIENRVRSNGNLYLKPFCEDKHMIIKELIDSLNNKEIYNFGDNNAVLDEENTWWVGEAKRAFRETAWTTIKKILSKSFKVGNVLLWIDIC